METVIKHYMSGNPYNTYNEKTRNCFMAVGDMANWLGDSRFKKFAEKYPYTEYKTSTMLAKEEYKKYWGNSVARWK